MHAIKPVAIAALLLSTAVHAQEGGATAAKEAPVAKEFSPSCKTPLFPQPAPPEPLGIDAQCGLEGSGKGAEGEQDAAKNNFCFSGEPKPVTFADLQQLQAQVEKNPAINFGDENTPNRKKGPTSDRTLLRALGEGSPAVLKAYVLIARQEGPESVNCGKNVPNQAAFHDIHISLVDSKDATKDDECKSVVAEMSPHRRPTTWNHANLQKVANAKALVRVTGQLFFDSSHVPCASGKPVRSNPKRMSLWELHPVSKFEVCTADCEGEGQWLPLDQWVQKR
jgi:hypothetical protein